MMVDTKKVSAIIISFQPFGMSYFLARQNNIDAGNFSEASPTAI